jgi:cystathionine beta-lyase
MTKPEGGDAAQRRNAADLRRGQYFHPGTPTTAALEPALVEFESSACTGVALLPSGLAAISTALLAMLRAGDHVLVTDNCDGPTRKFCDSVSDLIADLERAFAALAAAR